MCPDSEWPLARYRCFRCCWVLALKIGYFTLCPLWLVRLSVISLSCSDLVLWYKYNVHKYAFVSCDILYLIFFFRVTFCPAWCVLLAAWTQIWTWLKRLLHAASRPRFPLRRESRDNKIIAVKSSLSWCVITVVTVKAYKRLLLLSLCEWPSCCNENVHFSLLFIFNGSFYWLQYDNLLKNWLKRLHVDERSSD